MLQVIIANLGEWVKGGCWEWGWEGRIVVNGDVERKIKHYPLAITINHFYQSA